MLLEDQVVSTLVEYNICMKILLFMKEEVSTILLLIEYRKRRRERDRGSENESNREIGRLGGRDRETEGVRGRGRGRGR